MRKSLPSDATEAERQRLLRRYDILDTEAEQAYDDLARLAAIICEAPIAAVTFFDGERQWFKACVGAPITEAPMAPSFCTYTTVDTSMVLSVPDARLDVRFHAAPHVVDPPHVRAYAGAALLDPTGVPLGTICVFDMQARPFSPTAEEGLMMLSRQVTSLLEMRRKIYNLDNSRRRLQSLNRELDHFGYLIGHDLRAPIRHQTGFAMALMEDFGDSLPTEAKEIVDAIVQAGDRAQRLLEDIDAYLHAVQLQDAALQQCPLEELISDLPALLQLPEAARLHIELGNADSIEVPAVVVRHVLLNLLSNAIKYNDKPYPELQLRARHARGHLELICEDNGPGIQEDEANHVFEIFGRGRQHEHIEGRGLGLAISARLMRKVGGSLELCPKQEGCGAKFLISLPLEDATSDSSFVGY